MTSSATYLQFVRRIQSRSRDKRRPNVTCCCLDLFQSDTNKDSTFLSFTMEGNINKDDGCINETQKEMSVVPKQNNTTTAVISVVRVFLSLFVCCYDTIPNYVEQINALPRATELQIHISLDNGANKDESTNMERDCNNITRSNLLTVLWSIRHLLRHVTNITTAKLVLYAKEEQDLPNEDNTFMLEDWKNKSSPRSCVFSRSSIENVHIVLVTSSIFTSFAPSHGDNLPLYANCLIHNLLQEVTTLATFPNLQQLCLECDKSQCWAMETNYASPPTIASQWLEEIGSKLTKGNYPPFITNSKPLAVEIRGWKLDWSSMRGLCRMLRGSKGGGGHPSSSYPPRRVLRALTLSQCRWTLELRINEAKNIHDPSCDLVKALAENTNLQSLHLNLSMIPSHVFSWKNLSHAFSVHPTLISFQTTVCMKEQAFASLLHAYHQSSLEEITIPFFFGTWTDELLGLLRQVLFQGTLRKIHLRLQHVPARWSTDPAPAHRRNVWSLWKEYLLSENASSVLEDLKVTSLTPEEQLDLVSTLQQRRQPSLKLLSFKGSTSLSTILDLTQRLAGHRATRALPTHFDLDLWSGDELHATQTLIGLAQAIKGHYGILTMNLSCAEYSATPYADVLDDLYKDTESATRIRTILTLNNAGRRYMLKNPHCLILGTKILAQVALQQSVDAIFHHVMDHPAMLRGAASN
jgi:hypothetical protein